MDSRWWSKFTIDGKPWWSIVIVAALGALGTGLAGLFPVIMSNISAMFPSNYNIYVLLKDEVTHNRIDGASVSFLSMESQEPVQLEGAKENNVIRTVAGVAHARMRVTPGPGYIIILRNSSEDKTYEMTEPIEIKEDKQYSFEFNPQKWGIQGKAAAQVRVEPAGVIDLADKSPAWLKIAIGEIGQREGNNKRITEYFTSTTLGPQPDSTPWNSAFVNWVISQAGLRGTRSAIARSWLNWGTAVDLRVGCVAVLWRTSPEHDTGHVGFFVGESENTLQILGGNQHDSVDISSFPKSRLLACKWPA